VEWRLARETEVLGENLPQRHFIHHISHMIVIGSSRLVIKYLTVCEHFRKETTVSRMSVVQHGLALRSMWQPSEYVTACELVHLYIRRRPPAVTRIVVFVQAPCQSSLSPFR
jgi:hypothetical protein